MSQTPDPTALRILVVDDEPSVVFVVSEFLRASGHTVDTAANGQIAWDLFRSNLYDIVVTDRVMPEMDGDELAAAIKAKNPNFPVVMVTGFVDPNRDFRSAHQSIDVVVKKPFTYALLSEAITQALSAMAIRSRDQSISSICHE